jgi:AraC-like DNA-binding protein
MAHEHENAFDAPIYFSQPTNALLFTADILGRPMPARDLKLLAVMRTCLEQLAARPPAEDLVLDRLRTAIRLKLPEGYPALEEIAEELHLSTGAICRELRDAGTTYKDVVECVRRDLALAYVKQRQLPFSELAILLGYSELSAFSRAFRRWTGRSPREYRTRLYHA